MSAEQGDVSLTLNNLCIQGMHKSFAAIFEKLERQRAQLLHSVAALPAEAFHQSPPGKWSVAQVLTHLVTSERLTLGYMRKKANAIESLGNSGIKHALLLNLLKVSQRVPIRYKAPQAVVANTPAALPFAELVQQWDALRNDFKNFIATVDDRHVKRLVFKHPVTGRMDGVQALKFMYEHVNHHLPQVKSLLKK